MNSIIHDVIDDVTRPTPSPGAPVVCHGAVVVWTFKKNVSKYGQHTPEAINMFEHLVQKCRKHYKIIFHAIMF